MKVFENNLPFFPEISAGVIFFLLGIFISGLFIGFLQLRYINVKRNKLTNIGGFIGFTGLFLTGIPCSCELVLEGFFSSPIFDILLISGLLLTILGFFAEATKLDETFLYIIRVNFESIIRYSVTFIGAFLFNLGILVVLATQNEWMITIWPQGIAGEWGILLGIVIVWGAWFNHINRLIWNNRVLIFRTIELSISQTLVLAVVAIPILNIMFEQNLTLGVFLIVIFLGFIGISILYADLYFFGVPERLREFGQKFMPVIRLIVLVSAAFLFGIGFLYPESFLLDLNNQIMILGFRVYYMGIGILLAYRMWFRTINNFFIQTVRFLRQYYREIITVGATIPLILGVVGFPITQGHSFEKYLIPTVALIASYLIGVGIWYFPKHQRSRGINTAWSGILIFWSLSLLLFTLGHQPALSNFPSNLGVLIPGIFLILYLGMNSYLWRKEILRIFQQIWNFVKTNYRELVTVVGIGFMAAGSVLFSFYGFLEVTSPFNPIAVISLLCGFVLIVSIWRFPTHPNFRGVTSTLNVFIFLWGGIIWNWRFDMWSSIISFFYMGIVGVFSAYLWQEEAFLLLRRIAGAVKQFVVTFYRQLVTMIGLSSMFVSYLLWNEFAVLIFYFSYLLTVIIWHIPTRHRNFRGIATTLSVIVFFTGLFKGNWILDFSRSEFVWSSIILIFYTGTASVLSAYLWRTEVFLLFRRTVDIIIQFLLTYHRQLVTVIGLGLMILGLANWSGITTGSPHLFFGGYLLAVGIWHVRTPHQYFRRIATILSVPVFFFGLFQGNWTIDFTRSELVWPSTILILYIGTSSLLSTYLWRVEVSLFIRRTTEAIKQYIERYYRELCTVIGLSLMVIGTLNWDGMLAAPLFSVGYLLTTGIWHFPTRHRYFRGIATTLSIFILFWGIIQFSLIVEPTSDFLEVPFLITYSFIGIGSAMPIFLWRVELWQLGKQIAKAIHQAFMRTMHIAFDLMKNVWNSIKQAFRAFLKFAYGVLLSMYYSMGKLIQYIKLNFWTVVRYFFSITGFLMIFVGVIFQTRYFANTELGIILIISGFLFICGAWWENSIQILRVIGNSLLNFIITIRDNVIQVGKYLWAKFLGLIEFGRIYIEPIIRISATLLGGFLVLLGILGGSFEFFTIDIPSELFIIVGFVILFLTWRTQIISSFKSMANTLWNLFIGGLRYLWEAAVGVKNAIINAGLAVKVFFQTYYPLLIRYCIFFLGLILMAVAFQPWVSETFDILPFILFMIGYFSSFFAWYLHAYFRGIGTVLSTYVSLIGLYQVRYSTDPISWIVVVIGIAANGILWRNELLSILRQSWNALIDYIVETARAIKKSISDFLDHLWSLRWNILGTTGIILDLYSIYLLISSSTRIFGFFLLLVGSVLIGVAWNKEILNFLQQCINLLSKAVAELLNFASRIWDQFKRFSRSIYDSTFILLFVTLGILACGYGLILVISGIFDPKGAWTTGIRNIPIVGDIIWLIASFAQGRPFDLDGVTNLLGAWDAFPEIVLILLGSAIIFFGVLITFVSYIKREDIKVNKVKRRFSSSTSTGRQIDYKNMEGKKQ
ncbi:MAG: hypothetical protein ACXACW_09760 [Candidatus Hodarchaeales archaeon]|jgi:hypothetical protein